MTDTQLKPKSKHWRWIIAGGLLCLIAIASWWNWPRADARFVGTWLVYHSRMKDWNSTLQLRANGVAVLTHRGTTPVSICCKWQVKDRQIVFGREGFTNPSQLGLISRRAFQMVTGASWSDGPIVLDIQSIDDGGIRYKNSAFFKISGDRLIRVRE